MRYIPDQIQTHEIMDATLEKGKFGKKVIHHASGDPAASNDTGEGYAQGSIWINTTSGDMFICLDHSAEDAAWANMEGDDVNNVPSQQGSNYGFFLGGSPPNGDASYSMFERMALSSPYPLADYGEMAAGNSEPDGQGPGRYLGTGSNEAQSTGFHAGGEQVATPAVIDTVGTFPFTSPGTATDIGEMNAACYGASCGVDSEDTAFSMGGRLAPGTFINTIQSFALASPAGGADVSEQSETKGQGASNEDKSYIFHAGGQEGVNANIERFQKTTTNDGTDQGNLATGRFTTSGASDVIGGYAYVVCGQTPSNTDVVERYSFSSPANGSDVGEFLSSNDASTGKCVSGIPAGYAQDEANEIGQFTFASTTSVTDVSELVQARKVTSCTEY